MIWEADRYTWSSLRAMGGAGGVPGALEALRTSMTREQARAAYWHIDNTVIVQGALYEASLPTAACLVCMVHDCSSEARPRVLELMVQIGSGEAHPSEIAIGNITLQADCMKEITKSFGLYVTLLVKGDDEERDHCVDLVGLCCMYDQSLRTQAVWHLHRLLNYHPRAGLDELIQDWLNAIEP